MRTASLLKMAASTLVVAVGVIAGGAVTFAGPTDKTAKSQSALEKSAMEAAGNAQKALKANKAQTAVKWAERAVAASPNNADYRFLLGESYLAAGRFVSADTAFTDTLSLSPNHGRAALKLSLSKIAMGKSSEAIGVLEQNKANIPVADYGLALALAGDPEAAIRVLEPAARDQAATPKVRQNLALAYALAGRWPNARAVAEQDLPPAMVDRRLAEWAAFARPVAAWDQVSSLLGITPVEDPGQPAALALNASPQDSQLAAAEAPAAEVPVVAEAAPAAPASSLAAETSVVAADSPSAPSFEVAAAPEPVAAVTAPAQVAVAPAPTPEAGIIRANKMPMRQVVVSAKPVAKPARVAKAVAKPAGLKPVSQDKPAMTRQAPGGRYTIQLGAFSNKSRADVAWSTASKKTVSLRGKSVSMPKVTVGNGAFYRVSVSGFASREDAGRVCAEVRAKGGSCFVRAATGSDLRFARKGNGTRLARKKAPSTRKQMAQR